MLTLVILAVCLLGVSGAGGGAYGRARWLRRPREATPRIQRQPFVEDAVRRTSLCVAAGTSVGWVMFGAVGVPVGAVAGAGASWWLTRLESPSERMRRDALKRDLPLAVELLAACAQVGLPLERAVAVVSRSMPGPLGEDLAGVSARLALGADPIDECRALFDDPGLAALAQTLVRSLESGAPLADGLARLAADRRREQRTDGQVRARRVGVQAAGPLGLCFLPAFMLVGIVPIVVGTFSGLVLQ